MSRPVEHFIERALFASRWLLAPIYLGLALAMIALGIKFFQEALHLVTHALTMPEAEIVLAILGLIDLGLVGSLIVMVMFSGYENFVSAIDAEGASTLGWLGKLDAGTLKLKVAASIVAISSIHLLKVFMQVEKTTDYNKIMWYALLHLTFVVSALLLGLLDKISFAKHRGN